MQQRSVRKKNRLLYVLINSFVSFFHRRNFHVLGNISENWCRIGRLSQVFLCKYCRLCWQTFKNGIFSNFFPVNLLPTVYSFGIMRYQFQLKYEVIFHVPGRIFPDMPRLSVVFPALLHCHPRKKPTERTQEFQILCVGLI